MCIRENKLDLVQRLVELGSRMSTVTKVRQHVLCQTILHLGRTHSSAHRSTIRHGANVAFHHRSQTRSIIENNAQGTIAIAYRLRTRRWPSDFLALPRLICQPAQILMIVQLLLRSTNNRTRLAEDKNGCIPLHLCAQNENVPVCRELLLHFGKEQVCCCTVTNAS